MLNYERQYFKLRVVSQKKKGIGYPNPHHFYEFLTKVTHYLTAVKKKLEKEWKFSRERPYLDYLFCDFIMNQASLSFSQYNRVM